jgi:hypothetical protein
MLISFLTEAHYVDIVSYWTTLICYRFSPKLNILLSLPIEAHHIAIVSHKSSIFCYRFSLKHAIYFVIVSH